MLKVVIFFALLMIFLVVPSAYADVYYEYDFEFDGSDSGANKFQWAPVALVYSNNIIHDWIIVADPGNYRIVAFNSTGNFQYYLTDLGGYIYSAKDAVINSVDELIIADTVNNRIRILNATGDLINTITYATNEGADNLRTFGSPESVTVDSQDRIIVADTKKDRILIFDSNGEPVQSISFDGDEEFYNPLGVTTDSQDRIIVADSWNNRIVILDSNGKFVQYITYAEDSSDLLNNPYGVAVDTKDRIIVADQSNSRIVIFDSNGDFLTTFKVSGSPTRVTTDSNDRIIVSGSMFNKSIVVYYAVTTEDPPTEDPATPTIEEEKNNGGCADCTKPTFYKNSLGMEIVKDGFSWNYNYTDVTGYHTPYDLIIVDVNSTNTFTMKAYENQGIYKYFQIGFGIPEVGVSKTEAEVLLEIHLDRDGIEEIVINDDENLMSFSNLQYNLVECGYVSSSCVEISGEAVFREPLKYSGIVINAVDRAGNSAVHFINHGVNAEGESINIPPTHEIFNRQTSQQTEDVWLTLTRTDRINDIWQDKHGIQYYHNNEHWDRITPIEFERNEDRPTNVMTRLHSSFDDIIIYEENRASLVYGDNLK